jgi:hypothetical protein
MAFMDMNSFLDFIGIIIKSMHDLRSCWVMKKKKEGREEEREVAF